MKPHLFLTAALTSAAALAQSSGDGTLLGVDGSIVGDNYCNSSFQTVQTQFGDNENELNAAYGRIEGGRLFLAFTGNIQANFNKFEIFIDSVAGGENVLSGVPGNDFSSNMAGMTFDAGFEADYHIIVRRGNFGGTDLFDLDISQLGTANFDSYVNLFGGSTTGAAATGTGVVNASPIEVAYDDSNNAGILGGCDAASLSEAFAVTTGLELSIDLADIGLPAGEILVCAFQNNGDHNYASNQFAGGLPAPQCNLGGDGLGNFTGTLAGIDLNAFAGDQYFSIGACPTNTPLPTPIFGVNLRGDGSVFTTDIGDFVANFRQISTPYPGSVFALDFSADGTTLWGIEGTDIGTFDLATGAWTVTGSLVGPLSAAGLTAAPNGTDWYLCENVSGVGAMLWVGDIVTGVFTPVGLISTELFIDISMDATNRLFGMEISTDSLWQIDTLTGLGTLVGPTGVGTNFAQGMDFDWTSNILYATLYTGGGTGGFATLDLTTGAATVLEDTLPLNAEMEIAVRVAAGIPNFRICNGFPNSTGLPARLQVAGSSLAPDPYELLLTAHNLPLNSTGYFLNSPDMPFTVVSPGNTQGALCIASLSMGRHAANLLDSGTSGAVQLQVDLNALPQPTGTVSVMMGTIWSWQYWYRDVLPGGGATSNFSNARSVIFN